MALQRRILTQHLYLPEATTGSVALWRAPAGCRIDAVHARRDGGAAAVVNVTIDPATGSNRDALAADLTAGNAAYASASPAGDVGDLVAGDVLLVEVVTATTTPNITVQVDIAVNADVQDI